MISDEDIRKEEYTVNKDETNILFLHIIERAILDFKSYKDSKVPIEQDWYASAKGFLFDPEYRIPWGDYDINLDNILEYMGLDYDWFMRKLKEKLEDEL